MVADDPLNGINVAYSMAVARKPGVVRVIVGIGVAIAAWYTGVLFLFPDLECGPAPVLTHFAQATLKNHALEVCRGWRGFGDARNSTILQQLEQFRSVGDFYHMFTVRDRNGSGSLLVLFPDRNKGYRHNLLYRVAFWRWEVYTYPTYVMTSTGDVFRSRTIRFDSRWPPTDADLQELGETHGWSFERRLSLAPPCD